jgi:hypothetical protein
VLSQLHSTANRGKIRFPSQVHHAGRRTPRGKRAGDTHLGRWVVAPLFTIKLLARERKQEYLPLARAGKMAARFSGEAWPPSTSHLVRSPDRSIMVSVVDMHGTDSPFLIL